MNEPVGNESITVAIVYESLWGNTAAIARAIAEGFGPGAAALSTAEATPAVMAGITLIVAGAPLLAFSLPTDRVRDDIARNPMYKPKPDLGHPSMRSWLAGLPDGVGQAAAFETRIWWSPGSAAKKILDGLGRSGYRPLERRKFLVTGRYGPLKAGELEKAKAWGAELAERSSR